MLGLVRVLCVRLAKSGVRSSSVRLLGDVYHRHVVKAPRVTVDASKARPSISMRGLGFLRTHVQIYVSEFTSALAVQENLSDLPYITITS